MDDNNEIAIWYEYHEINKGGWKIGYTKNVGLPLVFMYSESLQPCPSQVQFWTYFGANNQWIQASKHEIKVSELSEFKKQNSTLP